MACRAGVRDSFARAEMLRAELAGWDVDDETLRRRCHAEAARAATGRAARAPAAAFAAAPGDSEVPIDAGKVNPPDGRRDVKGAVFARRPRGKPSGAAAWEQRELPGPSVRSVVAAVEEAAWFGDRCGAEARRLGLGEPTALTVLGDGAEWIGNRSGQQFPGAAEALDIYHAAEPLAAASQAVFGEGSAEARGQAERGRQRLLEDGYGGVVEGVGAVSGVMPAGGDGAALGARLNYFAGHPDRLKYALRLRRGQAIGSGLGEGSIKQLLNRRLKQTGARWQVKHVGPFVELCALAAGPEWDAFWNN